MEIGNWSLNIDNCQIIWNGISKSGIVLDNNNFFGLGLEMFTNEIRFICEKDFINVSDIFAFNSALMCAFEVFEISMPEGFTFSELIEEQIKIISQKGSNADEIVL